MNISLSNQGLNKRINKLCSEFLQKIFSNILNTKLAQERYIQSIISDKFNRIRILDSTIFKLPENCEEKYEGTGGKPGKSSIKIQLEYELKSGKFMYLEPCQGKDNDVNYGTKYLETVETGDLCIRDLGYFSIDNFANFENLGAKYISRLRSDVSIYIKNNAPEYLKNGQIKKQSLYKQVDLTEMIATLKPGKTIEYDEIYIGKNNKLKTRLVLYKLTDEQLKRRIARNKRKEITKRVRSKKKTLELLGVNFYITNIDKNQLPKNMIHQLYSLRWQIEIIFKIWKSIFEIDQVKPAKLERFECHLYGKLIVIVLSSFIGFKMRYILLINKKKEISEIKALTTIREYLDKIYLSLMASWQSVQQILLRIYEMICKNGIKSRKKGKKTVFDILIGFSELNKQKKLVA